MAHPAPLLDWKIERLDQLEADRASLIERINRLPKMSHKRVRLQVRLQELTNQAIEAQREATQ